MRNGASLPPRVRVDTALDALRRPRWLYDFVRGSTITFANLREVVGSSGAGGIGAVRRPRAERPERDVGAARLAAPALGRAARGEGDPLSRTTPAKAVRRGADAVYVSNHGGRQLDGSPATLDALPRIVEAVGDRAEVLLDGGVRRGDDVVKAVRSEPARASWGGRGSWRSRRPGRKASRECST